MAMNGISALSGASGPSAVYDTGKAGEAAEILGRYDLHSISFNERQALGRQLREAGVLNDEQALDFTSPSFMHMDANMRPLADEKEDFAGDLKSALEAARSRMDGQRSVPWLEKLQGVVESLMVVGAKA